MESKLDRTVETVKSLLEHIASSFNPLTGNQIVFTREGFEPFFDVVEELANEVSILETERQRLSEVNADLEHKLDIQKQLVEVSITEVDKLILKVKDLEAQLDVLRKMNDAQAKMLLDETYEAHYDPCTRQKIITKKMMSSDGMVYKQIMRHPDFEKFDNPTDYAINA